MSYILSAIFIVFIGGTIGLLLLNNRPTPTEYQNDSPVVGASNEDLNSTCLICQQVVSGIISLRKSRATRETMIDYLNRLCNVYTDWGPEGCLGRVNIETDTILYIIDHKEDLQPARFCGIYFQSSGCEDPNADSWAIPLPPISSDSKANNAVQNQPDHVTLQVLHISDVHLDPLYKPGSNSKCSQPLCCESGDPVTAEDAAGFWGDYRVCDMPWHTLEDMMSRIKETHKNLDWIYFTGDIVSHRTWTTSIQSNSESIKRLYALLARTFPDKTIFPVLGNHESHPGDFYSSEGVNKSANVSTQWLLDLSAEEWSRWLPNNTQNTIRKGGYYTVLVRPGFRVIALNSNVCYVYNLWLTYENKDTYDQLQWLVDVLTESERNGEKVHIIAHVPSSDTYGSCVKIWSREFNKIILRFADTITSQFNGHTHIDQFQLFFENSSDTSDVKAVGYNGGSFVTFVGYNPNYRIYEIDNNNMSVTNYNQYIFNLSQANANNGSSRPQWYKLYSFKEAYGLPDLTLKSLGQLYQRLSSNHSDNALVDQYFRFMYRDSDILIRQGCDSKCKQRLVCLISATETADSIRC